VLPGVGPAVVVVGQPVQQERFVGEGAVAQFDVGQQSAILVAQAAGLEPEPDLSAQAQVTQTRRGLVGPGLPRHAGLGRLGRVDAPQADASAGPIAVGRRDVQRVAVDDVGHVEPSAVVAGQVAALKQEQPAPIRPRQHHHQQRAQHEGRQLAGGARLQVTAQGHTFAHRQTPRPTPHPRRCPSRCSGQGSRPDQPAITAA
jgi:hypothetical protein